MLTNVTSHTLDVLFADVVNDEKLAKAADKEASAGKRRATYERLAYGWEVAQEAMSPARHEEFVRELLRRQVPLPKEGQNKFLPIVRCMWGRFDLSAPRVTHLGTAGLMVWKPDRSFEKYAAVYAWAEKMGYAPDNLADKLEEFKHPQHGSGISGVVAYWSALNGVSRSVAEKPRTFKAPKELEKDGVYVVVVDVENGKAVYRCPAPLANDERTRIINLASKPVEPNVKDVSEGLASIGKVWTIPTTKSVASKVAVPAV